MRGTWISMVAFAALGCSDASLKTFNAEPTAAITSHAGDEELQEEATTALRGTVADPDHDSADLLSTWRVNGDIVCEDVVPEDDGTTTCSTTLTTGAVTLALEVSDPGNATGSDSVTFTVTPNTPPDVSLTDPFEGERYYADEAIEFKGRVTDEEDAFDALTVTIESDIQGPLDLNTALNGEGRFSDFGNLDAGTHIITVTATDSGGQTGRDQEEVEVLPGNSAPTIASVDINPDPATATDTLSCIISGYEDADGDADESQYEWTVNGTVAGSNETLSDAFVAGDEVVCTVTPSDGEDAGAPLSDSIIISNSVPQIETVVITPDPAFVGNTLTCTYSGYADADGHEDASTYAWTINDEAAGSESTLSEGFGVGDTVTCMVTPNDGTEDGEPVSDSITISNTEPTVDTVVITPDEGVNTASTLTCAATFSDTDGEELSPSYSWTIGETDAGTGTELVLTPDTASPDDTVTCTATVTDGAGDSASGSDTVTVGNTGPEMLDVIIEPGDSITTATILTCEAVYTDADGEDLTLTYDWTRGDGTDVGDGSSVLELDPSFASPGDVYTCTATVTDPAGASATGSDSTTVGNTAPDIISVDITPDTDVRATTVLTCAATAEDDDGDVPIITYAWDISGSDAGEGNTLDLSDTAVVTGEVVTCTATATDALGDSDTGTDSVVIENTAPDVDSVSLSPDPLYTNDTLTATVSASDAESDTVSITYEWYVNSVMVAYGSDNTLSGFSHFDKGDEVYVVATPNDGMDDGEPLTSASIIVSNTEPTEPLVTIESGCDDGWTEMPDGIRCAKAFDTSTDWRDSQANCESHGGNLVRISDETDNDFVVDLYAATGADSVWFHAGMTDEAEEGTWVWIDGVDSAYRNWDPGQPDWDHEDCLEVVAGGWGNTTCDDTSYTGHVCQIEYGAGLTCIIDEDSTDADGDAITYAFAWDFEGDAYTDTGSSTYDGDSVPSAALSSDGTWTCTVTPNDGEEDGAAGSASYDFSLPEPAECTSLYFDGDDDMQIPASTDLTDFREGLTIESWVKWDGYEGHDWYPIATLGWGGDGSAARFFLAISGAEGSACSGISDPGYLHFEVQTRPSLGACISSSGPLEAGTWQHVAAVFDAGEARIYIDGKLESSAGTPDDLLREVGPSDLKIGRVDAGAGTRFLGSMSNVRYSSAAQYDGNFVPDWPLEAHGDTVGLWPLDEGEPEDISGNGHHGVLSGGTWNEECPDIYDGCWTASFDESTYVFCTDRLKRVDAEAECEALGMDLVKITDAAENDFVYSEAVDVGGWGHPGPWIGVQDKDLDGTFAWNDGEPLDYTEWCGAHPIDPGSRAYVHMEVSISESPCWAANGSWDTTSLEYVCEQAEPCIDGSGKTVECPGTDCLQILEDGHSRGDGTYWIDPNGTGPFAVTCDMTRDGGGWTGLLFSDAASHLDGTMVAVDAAPTDGIDPVHGPYTLDGSDEHTYHYTFRFNPEWSEFFLGDDYELASNAATDDEASTLYHDDSTDCWWQTDWNAANTIDDGRFDCGSTGDISFGDGEASGPLTSGAYVMEGSADYWGFTPFTWPGGTDAYHLGYSATQFRIGWGEGSIGHEGWYPWYNGRIYIRNSPPPPAKTSCYDWFDAGHVSDGTYTIKPDGETEIDVFCHMSSHGGGWMNVFKADNPDLNSTTLDYDVALDYWSDATEVMIGYVNSSYSGLTDTAMMDMPEDWLIQAPMRYRYESLPTTATINDGETVPVTLIYTTGDTGGGCTGGPGGDLDYFGRISVCGSDGPSWNGWAYAGPTWGIDRCSLGSRAFVWANCSSSRLFSIWAR